MRKIARKSLLLLLAAQCAHAQLRLPTLALPTLPLQGVAQAANQTDARVVRTVRQLSVERLIRGNRKMLEADSNGEAIVRGEIVGVGLSDAAIDTAGSRGFIVLRRQDIASLDLHLAVFQVPGSLSTSQGLRVLRAADPAGIYDYNHLYQSSGIADRSTPGVDVDVAAEASARERIRVGLIDSGVDGSHPLLAHALVHSWGCNGAQLPDSHGTAVASLLSAQRTAEIYAADVYCKNAAGGAAETIVAAFGWLAEQHVAVINVSLVGPPNRSMEAAIHSLTRQGYLVVAAVGNDGPASPPLYPAAYPGVIGVTGVDAHHRVLLEAVHGPQVMFAALGADLSAAGIGHGNAPVRGTSFAAPGVAVVAAHLLDVPGRDAADLAIAKMIQQAVDLGPAGRDLTYGYGFLDAREETAGGRRIP